MRKISIGEFEIFTEITKRAQLFKETQELSQEILDLLEAKMGYEFTAVLLLDPATNLLHPVALGKQEKDNEFVEMDKKYVAAQKPRKGLGITGWVAEKGEYLWSNDVSKDKRYFGIRNHIKSELCVPIIFNDLVIGVLNTESPKLNAYTKTDLLFQTAVAAQMALAFTNHQLYQQLVKTYKQIAPNEVLPMCSFCKSIRDTDKSWHPVESYLVNKFDFPISHGICPDCYQAQIKPEIDKLQKQAK